MENERLRLWQKRLADAETAYADEEAKMDERESLYRGTYNVIHPVTDSDPIAECDHNNNALYHVQNIVAENVEAQVNSSIPQPKVTARRKEDEGKAVLIENMLRNELNRLPFETMNDLMERMVPIQGGGLWLVEWDSTVSTRGCDGEVSVKTVHPKMLVPQEGVYSGINDMDYVILKLPQTKEYIRRRYGKNVEDEAESAPEVKSAEDATPVDDMVTQNVAYYRDDDGKIGLFSWCNDTVLEDVRDYQARHLQRCVVCGEVKKADSDVCTHCGGDTFEDRAEDFEEIYTARKISGWEIPDAKVELDEFGQRSIPTKIPLYKPDVYPVVLQKNVSVFGRFLGESDVDKIRTQQNTLNRLNQKIFDRIIEAGTIFTIPDGRADLKVGGKENVWQVSVQERQSIGSYDLKGDLRYEMSMRAAVYEEARNILGITDSFQGRQDSSASSGKAKEIAAAQSAGRLESKRIMKDAAFADLFRLIFQFKLAYADEPRPVAYQNEKGEREYSEFNRWDFLERDEDGRYWWNDQFLFSCDTAAPLANNREAMWNNTTAQLQSGCYGDPKELETLILYWTKMDLLHYPGAGDTLSVLRAKKETEEQAKEEAEKAAAEAAATGANMPQGMPTVPPTAVAEMAAMAPPTGATEEAAAAAAMQDVMQLVEEQARADAARNVGVNPPLV